MLSFYSLFVQKQDIVSLETLLRTDVVCKEYDLATEQKWENGVKCQVSW